VVGDRAHVARAATSLSALVPGSSADVDDVTVSLRVPGAGSHLAGLVRDLDAAGVALASVDVRRPTLDDVFLNLTGRSLREDAA
jgi:ABC-2 type transport system ATP-binding protein